MADCIAIVTLGRRVLTGEVFRVETWRAIAAATGLDAHVIRLADGRPSIAPAQCRSTVVGTAVPDHHRWSLRRVRDELVDLEPLAVVAITSRAYHPRLADTAPAFVFDILDSLADNYAHRSQVAGRLRSRVGYAALARFHERFERKITGSGVRRVVGAFGDTERFGARWVPITVDHLLRPLTPAEPEFDLVFFGTLSYAPNVGALRRLHEWWPELRRRIPGLTVLVSGTRPVAEVVEMARTPGWRLEEDYPDAIEVCRRARVAIAPLPFATGIQNKVLEAAAAEVPQVISPAAARGFDPAFPALVADDVESFGESIRGLLIDGSRRRVLAAAALDHVRSVYVAERYASCLSDRWSVAGVADTGQAPSRVPVTHGVSDGRHR